MEPPRLAMEQRLILFQRVEAARELNSATMYLM